VGIGKEFWVREASLEDEMSEVWFFFFFAVLGFELRTYTLSHFTNPYFMKGFFETESHEQFAWAGFEPQSLPLE
jgi:hypothetical protein